MCCTSMSMVRATNVASAASASDRGRTGVSNEPPGLVFDGVPRRLAGEYCPFVRP